MVHGCVKLHAVLKDIQICTPNIQRRSTIQLASVGLTHAGSPQIYIDKGSGENCGMSHFLNWCIP